MKIALPDYDKSAIGGGWTFLNNFNKVLGNHITSLDEADIYFIPSASMLDRDSVRQAKEAGKKIILRCDNIIRNSRNRNSGMTRMKDFADWSDLVIYQSKFARDLLDPYLQTKNNTVILNACDQEIFFPSKSTAPKTERNYLYVRSSTDETKNWEMARSAFQAAQGPKKLVIVGKGLENLEEYNFDFYQGEQVYYMGFVTDKDSLAEFYRNSDTLLYSYFNDACSNTLIEALCSGLTILNCYGMVETGGAPEITEHFTEFGKEYFALDRMANEYREAFYSV